MRPLFEPFTEYERIARNKPHPGIDKAYPKVTDGTTSSVIEKTPRRIFQKIPTGMADSDENNWLKYVASFILTNHIIPHANAQYPFLQKCQAMISKGLTYGSQPVYIPFTNRGKVFTTDMLLPYIKDVFLEPGKVSDSDSNYIFMRSWYQKSDLDAIIAQSSNLKDQGIDNGWDAEALTEIRNATTQKDDLSTTPNEKDKNNRNGGIEIVHCFQRGVNAKFYSIHVKSKQVVRTKTNKDPRGEMPIHYFYASADVSNPLGRGFVEMVGSMQNLMDAEVQMYQYNRALMLNPPMKKRGNWNKNQAKLIPNVLVDLGSDPNADWEPVTIDSSALNNFSQNYSLMQSQMYQLLSAPTSNVSASAGATQASKTSKGVEQTNANLNVDDTYIRNQGEALLEKVFETMLNVYFAEKTGVEELQLDQDTADDIRNLKDGEGLVSDDNKIRIDWNSATEQLNFRIEPGTSEEQDDTDEIAELKEIIADVNANPGVIQSVQQAGKNLSIGEVYKQLFMKLGLNEIDKILTDVPTGPDGQPQVTPPQPDASKVSLNYNDLDPQAKAAYLQSLNIPADPNQIAQYEQAKAQMDAPAAPDMNAIENHPIVKLMTSLNIKFTDLPEDSKHEVLNIIGIPSQMQSPVQIDHTLSAIQTAHTINDSSQQAVNQQAQMAQQDEHKQIDAGLQQQSQDQQAQQNQAQNALTAQGQVTDQAESPTTSVEPTQPDLPEEDQALIDELKGHGFSQAQVSQAVAMLNHGIDANQVLQMLTAGVQ